MINPFKGNILEFDGKDKNNILNDQDYNPKTINDRQKSHLVNRGLSYIPLQTDMNMSFTSFLSECLFH